MVKTYNFGKLSEQLPDLLLILKIKKIYLHNISIKVSFISPDVCSNEMDTAGKYITVKGKCHLFETEEQRNLLNLWLIADPNSTEMVGYSNLG